MKKLFSIFVIAFVCILSMTSCHFVSPSAEEEAVLIDHPIFFGHGGVNAKPVETGLTWCWFSGGEMTGKFRKVASHSAPEPAFGLFLNLPEGSAPWNPGTPIVVMLC